jgi:peptidoglycan/LPS O-acetylase OafA/YrhL
LASQLLQAGFMDKPLAAGKIDTFRRLQGLQVLRGLAALLVVWSHVQYNLGVPRSYVAGNPWLATSIGAIGVDIFFVISGFVIAMTAAKMGENWRAFLANRISRVVPLYLAVSGFLLVLVVCGFTEFGIRVESFNQVFNSFAFVPLFDQATFTDPLCGNGWTLSFEAWFYALFAGMMFLTGQRAGVFLPAFLVVGVFATATFYHSESWYLPKFLFNPLTLEFCGGCLLYHFRNRMGARALLVMCLLLPILLFWANHEQMLGQHNRILADAGLGFLRAGIWGGFSVCLVGVVTQLDLKHHLRWPGVLLLGGDASYSIYLIAPLIMPVLWNIELHFYHASRLAPVTNGCIYVLGAIVGGLLLWKYVEVPATKWTKEHLTINSRETTASASSSKPLDAGRINSHSPTTPAAAWESI